MDPSPSARLRTAANYQTLDLVEAAGGFTIVGLARDKKLEAGTVVAALAPLYPGSWLRPVSASSGAWEWRVTEKTPRCPVRLAASLLAILFILIVWLAVSVDWRVFRSVWR